MGRGIGTASEADADEVGDAVPIAAPALRAFSMSVPVNEPIMMAANPATAAAIQ